MANQNVYPGGYPGFGGISANGGWNPGGSGSDWQNFSQVYPQYQALMANNNASANAAMNRAGGMGASSGTPYSSALGQLAMQGASGLQSLFSHGGGGGGVVGIMAPRRPPRHTNAPQIRADLHQPIYTGLWLSGLPSRGTIRLLSSGPGTSAGYDAWTGHKASQNLWPLDVTGRQNEYWHSRMSRALLGLAGSGALQAAQNQWALAGFRVRRGWCHQEQNRGGSEPAVLWWHWSSCQLWSGWLQPICLFWLPWLRCAADISQWKSGSNWWSSAGWPLMDAGNGAFSYHGAVPWGQLTPEQRLQFAMSQPGSGIELTQMAQQQAMNPGRQHPTTGISSWGPLPTTQARSRSPMFPVPSLVSG